ncbi:MAG: PACE efflux transporter [Haemophilus parainfluenzae]|nr:PACE efflux transporter [Haemophilus parainfluenzae]
MSFLERLFHAILFETTVVLLSVFALYFFTEESVSILFGSMVLVSLTAMLWNLIFNYFLDKVFTGPREKRGVIFRTLHAISFEGGLLIFTVPIIAYFLKVDWITAFMMDFSLTVMVTAPI